MITTKKLEKQVKILKTIRNALVVLVIIFVIIDIFITIDDGNSGSSSLEMEEYRRSEFNEKFEYYGGNQREGSEVRSLCRDIRTNNTYETSYEGGKIIRIVFEDSEGIISSDETLISIDEIYNKIEPAKKYDVTVVEYDSEGYIAVVNIKESENER